MTHKNSLTTTNDLQKPPQPKKAIVILPGHPFYGIKVEILQTGKTDSQEWCLIKHPEQCGFNYRIPSRWLDSKIPPDIQLMSYQKNEIAFPFLKLQKLALFIQCKLTSVSSSSFDEDTVGSAQQVAIESTINVEENKEGSRRDMDQHSTRQKGGIVSKLLWTLIIPNKRKCSHVRKQQDSFESSGEECGHLCSPIIRLSGTK